jgi:hypothetical protein
VVLVEIPGQEKAEEAKRKNKPGAGRPAGTKKVPAKNKPGAKPDTTQLKILVLTMSGIVASRPGMEVWNMSMEEVEQIIEPLANILAKHNVGQATSEYADYIALLMAVTIIFVPKYLIWKQTRPKKEKKKNEPIRNTNTANESRTTGASSQGNGGTTSSNDSSFGNQLHGLIPAVGQY